MDSKRQIALVISQQDFRDEEYFIPKSVFEKQGFEVQTISEKKGSALGTFGGVVMADFSADSFNVGDYSAVVFVGGAGMIKNFDNDNFQAIAKKATEQGKIIGAICSAPGVLAKAGVLQGRKATCWQSQMDKSLVKILQANRAEVLDEKVVADGNIITANDPMTARSFGQAIVDALNKVDNRVDNSF